MKFIAKTFLGLEEILAEEIQRLGVDSLQINNRAVVFEGDLSTMYRANMWLRTASRVLWEIGNFKAQNAEDIYREIKKIDWSQHLTTKQTFAINSTVYSENFHNSQFVAYKAKDAIVDFFQESVGDRPSVSVAAPDIVIDIHISHNDCTISLDSSGESLHKRGYRKQQTKAPINEALAAGIIIKSGWRGECSLIDFMCGSGTILIEAAMIALNIPPGIYRKGFAFEKWKNFDKTLFEEIYNDDTQDREFNHKIYGYDLSKMALSVAEENVSAAGLNQYISLRQQNISDFKVPSGEEKCIIISNPPYGERLKDKEITALYSTIGQRLKHHAQGAKAWIISSDAELMKAIGLKPSYKIDMLNGSLKCELWGFDIFDGKRKDFLKEKGKQRSENRSSHFAKPNRRTPRRPKEEKTNYKKKDKNNGSKSKSFEKKHKYNKQHNKPKK